MCGLIIHNRDGWGRCNCWRCIFIGPGPGGSCLSTNKDSKTNREKSLKEVVKELKKDPEFKKSISKFKRNND